MGFFGRMATLLKSNINDLISKSEDPEKMLNQVIVDMNTQLVEAKKQVAVAIADEKRLQKQLQGETTVAEEWQRKAMLAIRAGDDELAKEALLRKKEHDQLAATFQDQWQKQKNATDQLKLALRALNNKIEEAKRKKNVLIAQKRRAEAMKSIQDTMSGLSQTSAFDTFDRMAEKINQMEAEAEAGAELSEEYSGDVLKHKFSKLEATSGADGDLEALKRQMGLLPPVEAGPPCCPPRDGRRRAGGGGGSMGAPRCASSMRSWAGSRCASPCSGRSRRGRATWVLPGRSWGHRGEGRGRGRRGGGEPDLNGGGGALPTERDGGTSRGPGGGEDGGRPGSAVLLGCGASQGKFSIAAFAVFCAPIGVVVLAVSAVLSRLLDFRPLWRYQHLRMDRKGGPGG